MATWTEHRGYTLELDPRRKAGRGASRYVRLALVRRAGLIARFNVTEARAEPGDRPEAAKALGAGRLLSWRWLSRGEAAGILEDRRRTLEALGYLLSAESESPQGEWDWLRELVGRQIEQAREVVEQVARDLGPEAEQGLRDVMNRLGNEAEASALERSRSCLGLERDELLEPHPSTLARIDRARLAEALPWLLDAADDEAREAARRWLRIPATAYEIDPSLVEAWLAGDGIAAEELGPRLDREGLAMVGPEALGRLARDAVSPRVRAAARRWISRLAAA